MALKLGVGSGQFGNGMPTPYIMDFRPEDYFIFLAFFATFFAVFLAM